MGMSKAALFLAGGLWALSAFSAPITGKHTFAVGDEAFLLDGKPYVIRCGEMHFARIPRAFWRQRLQMVKACGFNAVCAYMFWNYHEPVRGRYEFSGEKDVAEFCRTAQEEGLWVVLRPGPYTCAEWEFGGLPWWLMKEDGIRLRTSDPRYLGPACEYLAQVGKTLADNQITRGGNILMVQVENEYGFWGKDKDYMRAQYQAIRSSGFERTEHPALEVDDRRVRLGRAVGGRRQCGEPGGRTDGESLAHGMEGEEPEASALFRDRPRTGGDGRRDELHAAPVQRRRTHPQLPCLRPPDVQDVPYADLRQRLKRAGQVLP